MYNWIREKLFKSVTKEQAVEGFEKTRTNYLINYKNTKKLYEELKIIRSEVSTNLAKYTKKLIKPPRFFFESIAASNILINNLHTSYKQTDINKGESDFQNFIFSNCKSLLFGAGFAVYTPKIVMGIVGLLATLSTGTAISSLSGAAYKSATLAKIGGGTLANGGAGVAGGKMLLALATPIGASIAVIGSLFSGFNYRKKINSI